MERDHELTGPPREPSPARRRLRRFRAPVLLVTLFVAMLAVVGIDTLLAPVPWLALPVGFGLAAAGVAFYRWLSRKVELREDVPEVAEQGRWPGLLWGALLGFVLFCTVLASIVVFGGGDGLAWGSVGGFVGTAGMMISVATLEEILFRGVLFRILEERTGTVPALVLSSLLFGATHLANVNATLWGTLSIALTGGTMLAAAYVATRSLWFPIGLHFAWNFTHAGIFGILVSGSAEAPAGLFKATLAGPDWLTGGGFGPEASLIPLVVCLVPTVLLLRRAKRTGRTKPRPRGCPGHRPTAPLV
ncbi:membrane protease YdiL (CAAX protease family) [Crossiella equi]|uniref:Membrane protease YdiL (CAAX protease family) n=2 Tax=Crossiella equi TaxID=130796 RepID=A0ABS5ARN9_9PSEU|nr:type II CAAX endopeptidase family protein [Crossiella equi]MBP2478907.1 membrane protease YdiL (CAAX protease family) [Crossiella equi]